MTLCARPNRRAQAYHYTPTLPQPTAGLAPNIHTLKHL